MTESHHLVEWHNAGKEPKCPADPNYPDGIDLDVSGTNVATCVVQLPYPAERIGYYTIECQVCGSRIGCTTAGRADDPRSIKIPCKIQ
jgi:hypothetical protein